MADSKISALAAITSLSAADQLAVASGGASKSLRGDHLVGFQLDYVQITGNVTISGTTGAGATAVIDGNAVSFDGSTRVLIEFWSLGASITAGAEIVGVLYDGSTQLGQIFAHGNQGGTTTDLGPLYGAVFLTPSNASHTYHIKAFKTGGTVSVYANNGASGNPYPAWYRITVA